jgi:DNA repair protein RadC
MEAKPHYSEHRKRLRERFKKTGADGLHDYELLELLLTYAIPRVDVKPTAKSLLKRFGGISGVLDASRAELEAAEGLGPASTTLVRLVKELFGVYLSARLLKRDALSSPDAVVDYASVKLAGLAHEAFMVVYLNVKNEVIADQIVHEGTVDHAVVYPRRIVEAALANHASSVILVHNHPSGHPEPSSEDKRLTRSIVEAVGTVEIRVLDHLIVGKGGHFSFKENGLL